MKNVLNKLTITNPQFQVGYIELTYAAAFSQNWKEIIEITQKINMMEV